LETAPKLDFGVIGAHDLVYYEAYARSIMRINSIVAAAFIVLTGCGLTPYTTGKVDSGRLDSIGGEGAFNPETDSDADPDSDADADADADGEADADADGSPVGDLGPGDPCGADRTYDCAMFCQNNDDYSALGDGRCDDGPGIDLD